MQELIFSLSFLSLLSLALYLFMRRTEREQIKLRLRSIKSSGKDVGEVDSSAPIKRQLKRRGNDVFIKACWRCLAKLSGKLPFPVHAEQLKKANLSWSVGEFQACRLILFTFISFITLALGGLYLLLFSTPPCLLLSWYLPLIYLRRREKARQEAISASLPEFIDLLTIFVVAGQNLNQALPRAVSSARGPLADEFNQALSAIDLGMPRTQALQEIFERNSSPDLRRFCRVILRAERFGSPLSAIMENFSGELRHRRKNQLQERAFKAPVKILFPLVFLILPSFLLLTVGGMILGGRL